MEFATASPKVQSVNELKHVWNFSPENSNVFLQIENNSVNLLKKYGTLLNHIADRPMNGIKTQMQQARRSTCTDYSPYTAGTIIRMPGNTIHAGPPSDKDHCRAIFFYAATPKKAPTYNSSVQFNQVTLTASILIAIWKDIQPLERAILLEYMRRIQSNHLIEPSDTSLFISNYTLCLFVRISLFLKHVGSRYRTRQTRYIQFLKELCQCQDINKRRQFITMHMIDKLDQSLIPKIFQYDGDEPPSQIFLFDPQHPSN
jgi:hypothetical protein